MMMIFSNIIRLIAIGLITSVILIGANLTNTEEIPNEEISENNEAAIAVATTSPILENENRLPEASQEIVKNETPVIIDNKIENKPIPETEKKNTASTSPQKNTESIQISIKSIIPTTIPSITEVNNITREAIVNILCETESGGTLNPITGSGVIIDERGVILTNAHIAQLYLLKDFQKKDNVRCVIRTGSPAVPKYKADLLFVSPTWIQNNKSNITSPNPLGTGENDFALLLITGTISNSDTLPSSFPALVPNIDEMTEDSVSSDTYVAASYPAGFLGGIAVQKDLFLTSAVVEAQKIFTFKENTIDLIALGGSAVAQKGSSGGALVRQKDKKLVGIIVTTTTEKSTSERDLRAITTTHINRSLYESTGKSIPEYITGDLKAKVDAFRNTTFNYLKNILVEELTS